MTPPESVFNVTEHHTVLYSAICSVAGLSIIGCLIINITYLLMPELRKPPYPIIHRIALSDLISSVFLLIAYNLTYFTQSSVISVNQQIVFYVLWGIVAVGEFGSLCFHGLLSINLLINAVSPFADGRVLRKFFIPIYVFCVVYPVIRLTLWRYLDDGKINIENKSELPWEASIGISLVFVLHIMALVFAVINVGSLSEKLRETKRQITIQMAIYLVVYIICYSGPLIFRIEYLLDESAESPENPFYIWSEFSTLVIGFLNSVVWMAMPTLRDAVLYKLCTCIYPKKEPLIKKE